MTKKILNYASFILIAISIVLIITTLVNYYSYANVLSSIQSSQLTELAKFELQDSKNLYLYGTLRLIPWTCFVTLLSSIVTASTLILNLKTKSKYTKIR